MAYIDWSGNEQEDAEGANMRSESMESPWGGYDVLSYAAPHIATSEEIKECVAYMDAHASHGATCFNVLHLYEFGPVYQVEMKFPFEGHFLTTTHVVRREKRLDGTVFFPLVGSWSFRQSNDWRDTHGQEVV